MQHCNTMPRDTIENKNLNRKPSYNTITFQLVFPASSVTPPYFNISPFPATLSVVPTR